MDEVLALLEDTRQRLKARMEVLTRPEIAKQAGVGRYWLEKFDQGVLKNPTIENVRRLRVYLLSAPNGVPGKIGSLEVECLPQDLAHNTAPTMPARQQAA